MKQQFFQPPLESQSSHIPVHFTEPENTVTPMNAIEHLLVSQIKGIQKKQKAQRQCRICLENSQQVSKIIIPCRCTGSIEYAHEHCMKEWVKRRVEQEPNKKAICEVCHTAFVYRNANQRHFDCDQIKKHYQKDKKSVITFFVVYSIFWLVWIGILALVASSKSSQGMPLSDFLSRSAGMTVMASVLAIYILGMLVVTILLISEYFVREDVVISKVCNYYEPKNNFKNMRIYFKRSP